MAKNEKTPYEIELEEKLRTGEWVSVGFNYKTISKDSDFSGSTKPYSGYSGRVLTKDEYLALLMGGENAIKSFVQAIIEDRWHPCYDRVIEATMVKEDY